MDLTNFLQAMEKSTFVSQHEERWSGISSLYCECFVRIVDDRLSDRLMTSAEATETVNERSRKGLAIDSRSALGSRRTSYGKSVTVREVTVRET